MPASGEDVGEEGEGGFVFGAGGERKGIEIGKRDAEVLGLDVRVLISDNVEGKMG